MRLSAHTGRHEISEDGWPWHASRLNYGVAHIIPPSPPRPSSAVRAVWRTGIPLAWHVPAMGIVGSDGTGLEEALVSIAHQHTRPSDGTGVRSAPAQRPRDPSPLAPLKEVIRRFLHGTRLRWADSARLGAGWRCGQIGHPRPGVDGHVTSLSCPELPHSLTGPLGR